MADIGGVECTFVKGAAREPTERVVTYQVPGIDGVGAQLLGLGDSAFRFRAILYGTKEELNTWMASINAKKEELVVIVDDWGDSYDKCLIVRVSPPRKTATYPEDSDKHRCEILVEGVIDS